MHNILYSQSAREDLENIYWFIAQDNVFYAQDVIDKIDSSIQRLAHFPFLGTRIKQSEYFLIVEPRYRFKIVYRVTADVIQIFSIFKYQDIWNNEYVS